jgi:pimeloyl-ACP methyl ester carboxylesterase
MIREWIAGLVVAAGFAGFASAQPVPSHRPQPTIVLVHGAFAESASWNGVVTDLEAKGYTVVAVANPLRGVKIDAGYVSSVVKSIAGPVVLVGHSYGGTVITNATADNVTALVYVAGLAPEQGETAGGMTARFPGSTLGPTLTPIALADGTQDLAIQQSRFPAQFAADVPLHEARQMAATQRPIAQSAFTEISGPPAWKHLPSFFIYGALDRNIPPALQSFMAKRADARRLIEVPGASHVVMVSHPHAVAALIEQAAGGG